MAGIYLDNAATTPVLPEVRDAMIPYLSGAFGNPSSIHKLGRDARDAVEDARESVADLLGCGYAEVLFTSGGTESNNLAIKGAALANRGKGEHIITSSVEHHAVLNVCEWLEGMGFDVTYLPVDSTGTVSLGELEDSLREDTVLISIMYGNNEVGTIEPIEEIGKIASDREVIFHTDAVQAFGHVPIDVENLGIDLLSLSGHKLYGPKGIGALYWRDGVKLESQIHGGGQERKMRSSTENVPGIVGLGKAVELASLDMEGREGRILRLRKMVTRGILERIEQTRLNGHPTNRLPNNCNVTIKFVEGESVVLRLDQRGIYTSTGSACSSPDAEVSHVLEAMGIPVEDLHSSIRISLGIQNTEEEIDRALEALVEVVGELREMSPLW